MTEEPTIIEYIASLLFYNTGAILSVIGVFGFLLSFIFNRHISQKTLYVVSFTLSFIISYIIYWMPVWIGLSNSDQQTSWAPIFITIGVLFGLAGTFVGLTINISYRELSEKIKKIYKRTKRK